MSTEMQTKVQVSPAQGFTPALTGLLQRKPALCNTPRLVEDSGRDMEKLTLQRSSADRAGTTSVPSIVPRLGHDFSRVSVHSTGPGMIQAKLKINEPGDPYEQEADRVADAVMRMEEPGVQRQVEPEEEEEEMLQSKPLAGQITPLVQRQPDPTDEEEEDEELIQAKIAGVVTPEVTPVISSGIQSLQGGGQPLSGSERSFFDPRFVTDFSNVRVHNDMRAASVARSVNARAFTLGHNVVFGAGEYSSDSLAGRKLLAHELTHVVQQNGGSNIFSKGKNSENTIAHSQELSIVSPELHWSSEGMSPSSASLQRVCGTVAIGTPAGCSPFGSVRTDQIFSAPSERFEFVVNCDDFTSTAERNRLRALVPGISPTDPVDIHGFASGEGPAGYNEHLSCARALKARNELIDAGLAPNRIRGIYNHGATAGNRPENRSVVIPLAEPPSLHIVEAGFIGPLAEDQRRAAASCPINCDGRTLGTMHAMGLYFHTSRSAIVPGDDPTATGVGTALHFTETAIDIPDTDRCHCDDYRIIQVVHTTHPAPGRVSPYVDNGGTATPFYDAVFASGEGIHEIPNVPAPDAGERVQSTISIYDTPFRSTGGLGATNLRWEAHACVACIKSGDLDRILGCATYGFARTYDAVAGTHNPVTDIGPGCLAAPSATHLDALRTDPTTAGYDFEGR